MTLCAIIGDSIAVGLAAAHPGCTVSARVGLTAAAIVGRVPGGSYDWAAISAGSNNPTDPHLSNHLTNIRARVTARRVTWILPQHRRAAGVVRRVAAEWGDRVRGFRAAGDGVHPRSYAVLAGSVAS